MSFKDWYADTASKEKFANRKQAQELEEDIAVEAAAHLPVNSTMEQDRYNAAWYMPVNSHNDKDDNDNNNEYMTRELQNMHFVKTSDANSRSTVSRVARPDSAGYYARLGVSTSASQRDIRRAFLELSRRYHTDKHACQSHAIQAAMNDRFNELQEAYAVLIDPRQRAVYDAIGVHGLQYLTLIPASMVSPQNTVNYVQWLEREACLQRDAQMLSSTCDVSIYLYPELLEHMMWPFRDKNVRDEHHHGKLPPRLHQHQHQEQKHHLSQHEQNHEDEEQAKKEVELSDKIVDDTNNSTSSSTKSEKESNKSSSKEFADVNTNNLNNNNLQEKEAAATAGGAIKFPSRKNSANVALNEQTKRSRNAEGHITDNDIRNESNALDDRANSLASWTNNAGTLNIKTAYIDETGSMTGSGKWNGQNSLLFVVPLREESVDSVMTTLEKVKRNLHAHGRGANVHHHNNINVNSNNNNINVYSNEDIHHDVNNGNVGNEINGEYDANRTASVDINNYYNDNNDAADRELEQQQQQVATMKQMISRLPPHMVMLYDLRILLNAFTPKQMSGQYSFQHYIDSTRQIRFVVKNMHQMMSFKTFFERQSTIDNSAVSLTMSSNGVKVKTTYARKLSHLWNLSVQTVLWQGNSLFPKLKISLNRFLSEHNIMQVDWAMRFLGMGYVNVVFMHLTNTGLLSDKEDNSSNNRKNDKNTNSSNGGNSSYNDYNGGSSRYADNSNTYSETDKSKYTNNTAANVANHNGRSLFKYVLHKCATLLHWFDNSKSWMASVHLAHNTLVCSTRGVVDTIYCPLTIMTNQDEANKNVMNVRLDTDDKQIQRPQRHLIERFRLSSTISYSPWRSTLTVGNEITYHASPKLSYGFAFDSEIYCNLNWTAMMSNTPYNFYDWEHTNIAIAHLFRFVYNRNAHKITLPIIVIGNNNNLYCAAMWVALPRLCFSIAKIVYNKRSRMRERREAILLRREHFAEVDIARERASMEQMALQRSIDQCRTLEEKGNGLVIVNATYGVLEPKYVNESNSMTSEMHDDSDGHVVGTESVYSAKNSRIRAMGRFTSCALHKCTNFIYLIGAWPFRFAHDLSCNTSKELSNDLGESDPCQEETPLTIDVTLALQNLVHESALTLPPVTKSVLVGFCDPDPYTNEHKQLKITYRFQRKLHQVVYDDEDEVRLPQEAHLIHSFV